MRDLPYELGIKRAIPDARGNWTPVGAYEGWRPADPLVAAGLALVIIARSLGA